MRTLKTQTASVLAGLALTGVALSAAVPAAFAGESRPGPAADVQRMMGAMDPGMQGAHDQMMSGPGSAGMQQMMSGPGSAGMQQMMSPGSAATPR